MYLSHAVVRIERISVKDLAQISLTINADSYYYYRIKAHCKSEKLIIMTRKVIKRILILVYRPLTGPYWS